MRKISENSNLLTEKNIDLANLKVIAEAKAMEVINCTELLKETTRKKHDLIGQHDRLESKIIRPIFNKMLLKITRGKIDHNQNIEVKLQQNFSKIKLEKKQEMILKSELQTLKSNLKETTDQIDTPNIPIDLIDIEIATLLPTEQSLTLPKQLTIDWLPSIKTEPKIEFIKQ